jgi:pimeloyl-ACP methyl ester carboxylesterase
VPVLGGAASWGEQVGNAMNLAADNAQNVAIPSTGHWVAEQGAEQMLAALTAFLAPYRS